jgi:PAS domain S-box-containing protein
MNPTSSSPTGPSPTGLTTVLCIDADPLVLERLQADLAALAGRCQIVLATTGPGGLAQVEALAAADSPLLILGAVPETTWLGDLWRRFPQALAVAIATVAPPLPPERLYRRLPQPWAAEELRFTVAVALHRYRQERELSQLRCALAAAQQPSPAQPGDTLSASETQRRAILSAVPDIMAILTAEGQYLDIGFNQFAGERVTLGDNNADLIGATVTDAFSPELAQRWLAAIDRTLATGQLQVFEQQHCFGDRTQYEEVRLVPYQPGQVLAMVRDISGQKVAQRDRARAEASLSASEAQLRQLTENLPGMVYRYLREADGRDRFTYISPGCADLFGVAPEAGLADPRAIWGRVHPADLERLNGLVEASMANPAAVFQSEHRIVTPAGEVKWVRAEATPQHRDHCYEWHGFVRDITDRKLAEAARLEAEDRLRLALELSDTAIWTWDVASGRATWSAIAYDLLGLPPGSGQVSYDTWLGAVHPDDREATHRQVQRAIASGQSFSLEYRVQWPDGTERWLAERGQATHDAAGQPLRAAGVMYDITERKVAEQERQQAELALQRLNNELEQRVQERTEALHQAQENLEIAVEAAQMGTWHLDLRRDYSGRRSLRHDQLFGYTTPQREWGAAIARRHVVPEDQPLFDAAFAQAPDTGILDFEVRVQWPDQSIHWMAVRGRIYRDPEGTPCYGSGVNFDITDRKRAELALQESEARFRQITETIQEVFWMTDIDSSQIIYVSPAFETLWGIPREELYAGSFAVLIAAIHPDDLAQVQAALHPDRIHTYDQVYRIRRPDGELRWVHDRAFPLIDPDGQTRRVVGVAKDITDRQLAELALQESEARFRATFEQSALGLIEVTPAGQIVRVNQKFCDLTGYSAEALLAKTFLELTYPDDLALDLAHVEQLLAGRSTTFTIEKRYLRSDGSPVWVSLAVSLIRDGLGEPQYLLGVVKDIGDRKRAEQALREQEQFLRSIYEGVNQPVCVSAVAADGSIRVLGLNPAAAHLLGTTGEAVAGQTLEAAFGPTEAREILHRYRYCIATHQPLTFERAITIAGQTRWLLATYNPIADASGRVYRIVGSMTDISDRKRAEDSLQRLNQDLERRVQERTRELQQALAIAEAASRAKTTFLANMSHELRTPLNAILGFAQLMARDPGLGDDHRQSLGIINRSGEHLLMLINDILEMAKIEAGQVSPRAVRFDLDALLHTLSDLFDRRARERGLALAIARHPAVPRHLILDEAKLRQVLINLLSNAIKFTHQGRVELWVASATTLAAPVSPGDIIPLTFRVADTGIGIAAADVERLFQPFVQVSPAVGGQEGTGLGLAISRQFVQLLGGDIAVDSRPGQGATFSFTLAVPVAAAVDAGPIAPAAPVVGLAPGQPNYRIVVADDDDTHRYLITRLLRSVGFAVREATNGEDAIDLWHSWQPHLIWLDMRMPRRNGYETARYIRAQERAIARPATKLLALTANAFDEDRAQALEVGCDDFVRKPFQLDELLAKMAVHLGLRYRYGTAPLAAPRPPLVADGEAIALLHNLPEPLLRQIYHCTLQLDGDRLAELVAQLPADCAPLADRLAHHLNDFAFDTIQALLDQAFPDL